MKTFVARSPTTLVRQEDAASEHVKNHASLIDKMLKRARTDRARDRLRQFKDARMPSVAADPDARMRDTGLRVDHHFFGINVGRARSYGDDDVCPECTVRTGFAVDLEFGRVFAKRFALLVNGIVRQSDVADNRADGFDRMYS